MRRPKPPQVFFGFGCARVLALVFVVGHNKCWNCRAAQDPFGNSSDNLDYVSLYHEQMYLYCGVRHPLFHREDHLITAEDMQDQKYASFDFHSPNMMASHDLQLKRRAIVNNEEAMLPLILSGHYIGFLPDHMTKLFAHRDQMRAILPDLYSYKSDHFAITRRTPKMSRRVETFMDCLKDAHEG